MIKPVSHASPTNAKPVATSSVETHEPAATVAIVLTESLFLLIILTSSMPTHDEHATFNCNTLIIPKLTEIKLFYLCREQFCHKYYKTHLA